MYRVTYQFSANIGETDISPLFSGSYCLVEDFIKSVDLNVNKILITLKYRRALFGTDAIKKDILKK
jgi:hypothetical protein